MMAEALASAYPSLQHCGSFSNATDTLLAIEKFQPHIVFLDIDIPGNSGTDLFKKINATVPIAVFITSHPEFALEGFELDAFDYILKPLTEERLAITMKRILEYWDMKEKALAYTVFFENEEQINIRQGHQQIRIPIKDIAYLEAMSDYTKLVTSSGKYMTLISLSHILEQLPQKQFSRIHRSYAIAQEKIQKVSADEVTIMNTRLPIGKTYRKTIKQLLR